MKQEAAAQPRFNHYSALTGSFNTPSFYTCEPETFFLPVLGLVDTSADDFLDQILRVGPVDAVRIFHRPVRHCKPRLLRARGDSVSPFGSAAQRRAD